MDEYLQEKYIHRLSGNLELFKKTSNNVYNFRCPLCGDSKTNKTKARGYFFLIKGRYIFKCHNCGVSQRLEYFLKDFFHDLYSDMLYEHVSGKERTNFTIKKEEKKIIDRPELIESKYSSPALDCPVAIKFLNDRKIPNDKHRLFYYTDDFSNFVNSFSDGKYSLSVKNDKRIIIPFVNKFKKLIGFQGRTIDPNNSLRYISIKLTDEPFIFNYQNVDTREDFFVFEGPFDSLFIPNSCAVAGSDLLKITSEKAIFVFDNEPSNKNNHKKMIDVIERGFRVVCWPSFINEKDINDMILSGKDVNYIRKMLLSCTESGQAAHLQLLKWMR